MFHFEGDKDGVDPDAAKKKAFMKAVCDDAVWYDAVVQKVTPKLVEVFYPEDDETKRHNLLVSGITKKRPKPLGDYLAKGVRWKVKQ